MKQNGESDDAVAKNVQHTNGDEISGEIRNCEVNHYYDVEVSSDEDEDTEHDTVDEDDEDSRSSNSADDVLDSDHVAAKNIRQTSEINGEKQNRDSKDNYDVEVSSEDEEDTEHDTVEEDDEDRKSSSSADDVLDYVFGLPKMQIGMTKLAIRMGEPIGPPDPLPRNQYEIDVLQAFKKEKARVKGALASLDSQICLSIDTINEVLSFDNYLQLSAHFIDEKWKLKKLVLKYCRVYTFEGEEFDEAVLDALKDWEIEGKVFSFTMVGALQHNYELVQTFKNLVEEKKKVPLDGELFGVDCCARICTLMAKDAYKEISCVISKVQGLIPWLIPPVWHFPAYKLKDALELESKGEFSKENIGRDRDVPSAEEWEKGRFVSNLVIGVYETVKTLFETKYPTANNFLYKFQELRAMLFQEASCEDNFKSKVAKKMLERLDKYWDGMSLTLAIASVMDPRFKMRYFDYLSSKGEISGNKLETSVILDAIRSLYGDYATEDGEKEYPVSDDDSTSSDSEDESPKTAVDEEPHDSVPVQEYIQFIQTINQPPKSDLDRYLEDPVMSWSQDFNVLSWWRVEGTKYPTLSKMARDILAIPMSVATSREAYLKERVAHPRISSSRTDEIKNALVCIPTWAEKPPK